MTRPNSLASLNREALILSVSAIKNDDTLLINELGLNQLDGALKNKLSELSLHHILSVEAFRGCIAQTKIVPQQLEYFIRMATSKSEEDALINEAIKAGMRQPILEQLKGVTRREYTARRQKLNLPENPRGRIENLSEDDELKVLRCWKKHSAISDPLSRYLQVNRETGITLDRACIAIAQDE